MRSSIIPSMALAALATTVSADFNPNSKTNVAVYWGQGPNQQSLLETCQNPSIDIVNVGFLNAFPDNSPGNYPGLNLGNACGDETYYVNGVSTLLKSNCPRLEEDIISCQQQHGKKVFLSLGGAAPLNYYIASDSSANSFADFVWGAFGPVTSAWTNANKPRPFGRAVIDGLDFDIESKMNNPPKDGSGLDINDYKTRGYATMINRLKYTLFGQDSSKRYYISGAPQCPLPDEHLSTVIADAWFDFLFVQFYNNPSCSARAMINYAAGDSLLHWTQAPSKNPGVKIYVGLSAHPAAATSGDYLTQAEAQNIVQRFSNYAKWGGIMLWEATYSNRNIACGAEYATWMKSILMNTINGKALPGDVNSCSIMPPAVLPPSSAVQEGIVPTCNKYMITNGDGAKCNIFAPRAGITEAELYKWNPVLGPNGENCGSKFLGNTYYCVGVTGGSTSAPQPIQPGTISTCNKYMVTNTDGAQCSIFAPRAGITEAQLYAWNPVLGSSGEYCRTNFLGGYNYCVGVSTPTAAPAPGPTQSGIINTCNKYAMANPGGACPIFANRVGISEAQLYAWNKVLGSNGENCRTSFWGDTYYCVGVSGNSPLPEPTSTGAAPAPAPTQSGIINTCNKYQVVNTGGSCPVFADRAGISTSQLYAWNSILDNGRSCATNFWAGYAYCIGVRSSKTRRDDIEGYGEPAAYPVATSAPQLTTHVSSATTSFTTVYTTVTGCPTDVPGCHDYTEISTAYSTSTSAVTSHEPTPSPMSPAAYSSPTFAPTSLATPSPSSSYAAPSSETKPITMPPAYTPTSASPMPSMNATSPSYSASAPIYSSASSLTPVSVGTTSGYASPSGTSAPNGTGAAKPSYSGPAIEPYTGAAWRQSIGLGFVAMAVGAAVALM